MPSQTKTNLMQNGFMPAAVTGGATMFAIGLCLAGLFLNVDRRLVLTYSDTFSGLADIRDLFLNRSRYTVMHNPLGVAHVQFPRGVETLEELEDLERRGLLAGNFNYSLVAGDQEDPSLLRQLMRVSWCSSWPGLPGRVPAERTPGCKCIADAYQDFVNSSLPPGLSVYNDTFNSTTYRVWTNQTVTGANGTNQTVLVGVNVTNTTLVSRTLSVVDVGQELRRRVGDRVYRCWDLRQMTRALSCGRICTTHVVGLALFANIVLFLTCFAYVAFYALTWNVFAIKLLVVVAGAALSIAFAAKDAEANTLSIAGIVVCLFYLTVSLHGELDRDAERKDSPHPLMTCLLVNMPLILSAHTIQLGVSGYGRDIWAFVCFGFCGALQGLLLQVRSRVTPFSPARA